MRELTMNEISEVSGGSSTTGYVMGVVGSWASTVAGTAVGYTLKGTAVGGAAGAVVGLAAGVIIGTGVYLATK